MSEKEEISKIEKLNRKLYQRKPDTVRSREGLKLRVDESNSKKDWTHDHETPNLIKTKTNRSSFLVKFLIGSILFFALALGVSGYIIYSQSSVISSANVDLQISAPAIIKAGDVSRFQVVISNSNRVSLQNVEMSVEFPDGTRSAIDPDQSLERAKEDLGDIRPGETLNKSLQAILFGGEGTESEIQITLQYEIPGSNASYTKQEKIIAFISSAPVALVISAPDETSSGQDMSIEVKVVSNSQSTLRNLLLVLDRPSGFSIKSASPSPVSGQTVWSIGDLEFGQEKTITLNGSIDGQDGEVKPFKFSIGEARAGSETQIRSSLNEVIDVVALSRPFVNTQMIVNGSSLPDSVVRAGEIVRVTVEWTNNLPTRADDVSIVASFDSQVLDEKTVDAGEGFFNSNNKTITWDKSTLQKLSSLQPGETGKTSFTFNTKQLISGEETVINPVIKINLETKAKSSTGANISTKSDTLIKLNSDYQLASRAVFSVGPFTNSGPIPPSVGQTTTYTINWSVISSSNDIEGALVTAVLPNYISYLNNSAPSSENISFNPNNNTVTWSLSEVDAGTGVLSPAREVSFQISFTPSQSHVGREVVLVRDIELSGVDSFTERNLTQSRNNLTTNLSTDPNFEFGGSKVTN